MAVITFANAKGGAGKTTAALILSTELARQGHRVVVLDADPQRWITSWAEASGHIANLTVISHITPGSLECHIREMKDEADYIVIDLAGAKDQIVALALAISDQVLIPVQGCAMDARGAAQILELIRQIEDRSKQRINHSVVLTRVNSLVTTRAKTRLRWQRKCSRCCRSRRAVPGPHAFRPGRRATPPDLFLELFPFNRN